MAQRRTLSMKIIDSDAFLDLPLSAQALYFHLILRADDDGFLGNALRIARQTGGSAADLSVLIHASYVLAFPSGVTVIRHWGVHFSAKKDRYHPTVFTREMACLKKQADGAYEMIVSQPELNPQLSRAQLEPNSPDLGTIPATEWNTEDSTSPLPRACAQSDIQAPSSSLKNNKNIYPVAAGSAADDADKQAVLQAAKNAGFSINTGTINRLLAFLQEFGKDALLSALAEAVDNNAISLAYVRSILQTWRKFGGKEASQALHSKQQRFAQANGILLSPSLHHPREPNACSSRNPFAEYEEVSS